MKYDKHNRKIEKLKEERDAALSRAEKAQSERNYIYLVLDGVMHETRRLNSEISSSCEDLSKLIEQGKYELASQESEGIFYKSGLLSSRLTFADFELNPESLSRQSRYSAGIFKKFDKARRILLRNASKRRINIRLVGPSHNEVDILPAFEMIPFVLLDNAVKYSPDEQEVVIHVTDNPSPGRRIEATISSIGPTVEESQIAHLCERGFRGSHAERSRVVGQGIGLYLANTLVRLSNGKLEIRSESQPIFHIDGVGYSEFSVTLTL